MHMPGDCLRYTGFLYGPVPRVRVYQCRSILLGRAHLHPAAKRQHDERCAQEPPAFPPHAFWAATSSCLCLHRCTPLFLPATESESPGQRVSHPCHSVHLPFLQPLQRLHDK